MAGTRNHGVSLPPPGEKYKNFNLFPIYFAQCSFTEMKSTFIKLQNESLPKVIGQELLLVNNSV